MHLQTKKDGDDTYWTQRGDLVTDAQSLLNLWREHFFSLLNGSESVTPGDGEPDTSIDDDETNVLLPDFKRYRIGCLKTNNAAGANGMELFKYGAKEMISCIVNFFAKYSRMKAYLTIGI